MGADKAQAKARCWNGEEGMGQGPFGGPCEQGGEKGARTSPGVDLGAGWAVVPVNVGGRVYREICPDKAPRRERGDAEKEEEGGESREVGSQAAGSVAHRTDRKSVTSPEPPEREGHMDDITQTDLYARGDTTRDTENLTTQGDMAGRDPS